MRGLLPILLAAGLAAAPQAERPARAVHVPVRVEQVADEGGGSPPQPPQWSASLLGAPVTVGRVLGPSDELMLLVVGDVTGDLTLVDTAKRALIAEIREMPPQVWVGLLRAQDGLRVLVDPTGDRERIAGAIQSLPVSGRAGLLESIQPAAALGGAVLAKAGVRVAVLFLTDSDVRNSREDFSNPVINESDHRDMSRRFPDALIRERISKLETGLSGLETPVFVLHLAYRSDGLNVAYQTGLMRLASVSGGDSVFCRSQNEIPGAVGRMVETIRSHYSLEIPVPADAPEQLEVNLECDGCALVYRSRFRN